MFQGNVKRNRQQAGFGQEASFPVLVDRAPSAGSKRYHKQRNSHCRPGEQLSEVSKAKPTQQYSIPGTKCVDRSQRVWWSSWYSLGNVGWLKKPPDFESLRHLLCKCGWKQPGAGFSLRRFHFLFVPLVSLRSLLVSQHP